MTPPPPSTQHAPAQPPGPSPDSPGLAFAIDALYAAGWTPLDTAGCARTTTGRLFPTLPRIGDELAARNQSLTLRRAPHCWRARWRDASGTDLGSVVGTTPEEAAVFALARALRP
jgi:hypothetical protein